ncbi:hypothetical protein KA107_01040, partial [Candidatus Pacearchaeota archaeon]|nr:hypothetical protein [Candidatus Pacearchaeota archaeon]
YARTLPYAVLVKQKMQAKSDEQRSYLNALSELPAVGNEIANAERRGLSEAEKTLCEKWFAFYLKSLADFYNSFKFSRNPVRDLNWLLCNSPGDDYIKKTIGEKYFS